MDYDAFIHYIVCAYRDLYYDDDFENRDFVENCEWKYYNNKFWNIDIIVPCIANYDYQIHK